MGTMRREPGEYGRASSMRARSSRSRSESEGFMSGHRYAKLQELKFTGSVCGLPVSVARPILFRRYSK